jgi:hypothetical protein
MNQDIFPLSLFAFLLCVTYRQLSERKREKIETAASPKNFYVVHEILFMLKMLKLKLTWNEFWRGGS